MTDTQTGIRQLADDLEQTHQLRDAIALVDGLRNELEARLRTQGSGRVVDLQEHGVVTTRQEPALTGGNGWDAAVDRRTEELATRDRNMDYRHAAEAQLIDEQGPQFEAPSVPVRQSANAAGLAELRRRNPGVRLGEEVLPNADTMLIRQHASKQGISEAEAEQALYDKGEIR